LYGPYHALHSLPTRRSSDLSKVRSIVPLHLEWEEERMLMLTLAQQAHYMRQLCWLSSIPKPGLPSLEYPPSPVRMRTSLTVLPRSEEHTSELQSRENLVCRL